MEHLDAWTRFDLWAERAHQAAQEAIAVQRDHGNTIDGDPLGHAHMAAADIYASLANAARPANAAPAPVPVMVVTGR